MTTANELQTSFSIDPRLPAAFPPGFLWGAATAAYQIEGAITEDGRGRSIWDMFSETPGKTYQGETGAIAADHYHRLNEDVELMARLGVGAYRFSVAWPRVLPEGTGAVNPRGLDFYDRLVDTLLARNIRPLVTLYHWDLPVTLHERGGWRNRATAEAFADYAEVVARRLGDRVSHWLTINEPWVATWLGYATGEHAPGIQDRQAAAEAAHHLLLGHGLALPRLRAHVTGEQQLGITLDLSQIYAADDQPETARAVAQLDAFKNRWFLDPVMRGAYPEGLFARLGVNPPPIQDGDMELISAPIDFLGVNNYSRGLARANPSGGEPEWVERVPGALYTEMGWEVFPQGLTDLLVRLHREYGPRALIITENGAAFPDTWNAGDDYVHDELRQQYVAQHIAAVAAAIEQGAPVTGYFVWSLLDNFEWGFGYSKRFGLVYVDFPTQRRIMKDSGRWYTEFLAALASGSQR
jgi:beta-glucosidase